jgi:cytochrome c
MACHAPAARMVGPSWSEIAKKYKGDAKAAAMLAQKVKNGGVGNWGQVPMPAHPNLKDNELSVVVQWVLDGAK